MPQNNALRVAMIIVIIGLIQFVSLTLLSQSSGLASQARRIF